MKKSILILSALACLTANAQETYLDGNLLKPELNGTARYVGMGGAMEALGADISTIGTNPAGIGLFRRSTANVTFGLMSQQDAPTIDGTNKTHASFDQAGFVYSTRTSSRSFLNFAFNYSKSRDFNFLLDATGSTNGGGQNLVTANKGDNGIFDYTSDDLRLTQLDYLYGELMCYDPVDDNTSPWLYYTMDKYNMQHQQSGYIGQYDFNISGNSNNRFYWGITVGIHDVHFNSYSDYLEMNQNNDLINVIDENRITGTGFDVKAGIIFRPVAESPFRIGLSVSSPTWYELKMNNVTSLAYDFIIDNESYKEAMNVEYDQYKYKLYTPWKFGASIGHTIGQELAIGASYEYADYGSTDNRYIDYESYYWADSESSSDTQMNRHTKKTLKGVSTLKLGAEFKPDPAIAVRLGFNYVSPMYQKNGVKPGDIYSVGNAITSTAYTNWEDTYRITAGLGYNIENFNIDLAYQYSTTNGKFTPYYDPCDSRNTPQTVEVSDKRHQLMLTLGYRF